MRPGIAKPARTGLVLLNVALLGGVVVTSLAPRAGAQNASQPQRARGDYTMVAGKSNQGGSELVYVVDASNQDVVVLKFDQSKQGLVSHGYRSIAQDGRATPGR